MKRFIPYSGRLLTLAALTALAPLVPAQNPGMPAAKVTAPNSLNSDLEPVAMHALQTMSNQLQTATSFAFTARVMREEPGTNGQMLDFFRTIHVEVQRPNKMRMEVVSDTSDVRLWYDGKNVTLMPAGSKIYTTLKAPPTIDATLDMLKAKLDAHMPLRPFLSANPYSMLSEGLQTASEVGFENEGNEQVLHLAFTEPEANWQLWLTGPNQVLPVFAAATFKKVEGQPRMTVEFSNWNMDAAIPADAFAFMKPQGAVAVPLEALRPRRVQAPGSQGGNKK